MGLWSYIARKIEPHLKELICTDVSNSKNIKQQIAKSVDAEIAKIENVGLRVLCSVDVKGKTLEGQVSELRGEVNGYSLQVAEALRTVDEAKRLVSQAQGAAESANARALSAETIANEYKQTLDKLNALIKTEEILYTSIDEKINEGIKRTVVESAAKVDEEFKKAMVELRKEYLDLKLELLENISEKFIKLSDKSDAIIKKSLVACTGKVDSSVDEFTKSSSESVAEFKKLSSELIADLESFRQYAMETIIRVADDSDFIVNNMPHVVYIRSLTPQQKRILTELYDVYHGNVSKFKGDLSAKCSAVNGKTELSPDELQLKYTSNALDEMLDYQKINKLGGQNNLREVLRRVDNWYTQINAIRRRAKQ